MINPASLDGKRKSPSLLNRVSRALRVDLNLYEEVEADKQANGQAAAVALITSVIAAISVATTFGIVGLLVGTVFYFLSFSTWVLLNYWIGAHLFPEKDTKADWGELFRTMGFALSPRIFLILLLLPVPVLQTIISITVTVWTWVGMIRAIRSALDYTSTFRAVGVTFVGLIVNVFVTGVFIILITAIGS